MTLTRLREKKMRGNFGKESFQVKEKEQTSIDE
jgi:hypothetical protein